MEPLIGGEKSAGGQICSSYIFALRMRLTTKACQVKTKPARLVAIAVKESKSKINLKVRTNKTSYVGNMKNCDPKFQDKTALLQDSAKTSGRQGSLHLPLVNLTQDMMGGR